MTKVLAFDVSETLQTGADHNDGGRGQFMVGPDGVIIPGAYSVLVGGQETADLLIQAQRKGLGIVLVTNNGDDLDREVISRTLAFLANYGITLNREAYLGPPSQGANGSKVPRLEATLNTYQIAKDELVFFDDSRANVEEAQANGFKAIRVKTAHDLQEGIRVVLAEPSLNLEHPSDDSVPEIPNPSLAAIDNILTELKRKIERVEQHVYPKAHQTALELLEKLDDARNDYARGLENPFPNAKALKTTLLQTCQLAINDAKPVLEKDLGWGDYLSNLLKSFANIFIGVFSNQRNSFYAIKRSDSAIAVETTEYELDQERQNP